MEGKNFLGRQLEKTSKNLSIDHSLSPDVKERILLINALMVQIFLDSKDIKTHNLLPYIRYLVNRFGLSGDFCEFEILIEAYAIAIQKTKDGYVINNLPAWFKGTALNIVRNLKGEIKKQDLIKSKVKGNQSNLADQSSHDENRDEIELIIKAFKSLSKDERDLLNLRIVNGLTWSDIAERMIADGKEITFDAKLLTRLRQKHKRALDHLRKKYLQQMSE